MGWRIRYSSRNLRLRVCTSQLLDSRNLIHATWRLEDEGRWEGWDFNGAMMVRGRD